MRLTALLLGVVLALTGCGGKDLSPQGFVDAVNGTCQDANGQLDRLPPPALGEDGRTDPAALAGYLREALRVNEAAADQLRALRAPEEMTDLRSLLAGAMDEANAGLGEATLAAERADEEAMARAIVRMEAARDRFNELAGNAGLHRCLTPVLTAG